MKTSRVCMLVLLAIILPAAVRGATIATVPVGNAGNMSDIQPGATPGAVSYEYRIGKFEVTNAQYAEFLNAVDPTGANTLGLYNSLMSGQPSGGINLNAGGASGSKYEIQPGRDDNALNSVSWYAAIRFANWLHNGQGNGDTESGAYTLLGGTPIPSNGPSITRNSAALWFLPSEDEWYKAAYHKNDGVTGNYWLYPTGSDIVPTAEAPPGGGNSANVGNAVGTVTEAGAYTLSESPYGTFDQAGNVIEWTDSLVSSTVRVVRGGGWGFPASFASAADRRGADPGSEINGLAFRVATIPEPSSLLLGILAALALMLWRRPWG